MLFDWDDAKCEDNIGRRGVDFAIAARIFAGPVLSREDRRREYGEQRFRAVGRFEGQAYVVVYTLRGEVRHIITAWKVGEAGEKRYRTLLAR
ncbi:MAG TPA: BrnT family toxin [Bauldia sp.]|nr:BrnT family toxin [Bauldia sp.]